MRNYAIVFAAVFAALIGSAEAQSYTDQGATTRTLCGNGSVWIPCTSSGGGGGGGGGTVTQGPAGSSPWLSNFSQFGGVTVNIGQQVMASSLPVTIASNQSALNVILNAGSAAIGSVTVSNFPGTQPVSGTVALGAGSAAVGSVTVSNFPSTQPVSISGTPNIAVTSSALPTGAATAANQEVTVAGTTATSAQGVQGVTGGVPFNVNFPSLQAVSGAVSVNNFPNQPITPVVSASTEAGHVLKGSSGTLYGVSITTTTACNLMVLNATTIPSSGSTVAPLEYVTVPANQTVSLSFGSGPPEAYSTGIVALCSTTGPFTYTASSTAFFHGSVQ
jgi:hypothetical protein